MKILITFLLTLNLANAECDFSKIQQTQNGYVYSKDLHICVGRLVEKEELRQKQVEELNKAITLKDLAIQKEEDRAETWKQRDLEAEDRLLKKEKWQKVNDYVTFGLGFLAAGIATILAGKVYGNR